MSPDDFRRLALSLPEAAEGAHVGHPDFRVGGKVFATLGYPDVQFGVIMLSPDEQALRIEAAPDVFAPVKGGWGRKGSTQVRLEAADESAVRGALAVAWRLKAPKRLLADTGLA